MNNKAILIVTLYRLSEGSGQGLYTVKAQLDYNQKKVKTSLVIKLDQ